MTRISVSILDCDLLRLGEELKAVEAAGADAIHLDVMDGHFVPNLSFGVPLGRAIQRATHLPVHSHLMVDAPETMLDWFAEFSRLVVFHLEATRDPLACVERLRAAQARAGVSLNPDTTLDEIEPLLAAIDEVLLMSVFPGKGGQRLIEDSLRRIGALRQMLDSTGSRAYLAVDGGITPQNCQAVVDAGADIIVAGSAIFRSPDYHATISSLRCSKS